MRNFTGRVTRIRRTINDSRKAIINTGSGTETVYLSDGFADELAEGTTVFIELTTPVAGEPYTDKNGDVHLYGVNPETNEYWEGVTKGQQLSERVESLEIIRSSNVLDDLEKIQMAEELSDNQLAMLAKYNRAKAGQFTVPTEAVM